MSTSKELSISQAWKMRNVPMPLNMALFFNSSSGKLSWTKCCSEVSCELFHSFCSKTDRLAKGSECYQKSLSLNPFLWSPFESLCEIGESAELFYSCHSLERFLWAAIHLKSFAIVENFCLVFFHLHYLYIFGSTNPDVLSSLHLVDT